MHRIPRIFCLLVLMLIVSNSRGGAEPREAGPRFKGVELYSWRDGEGNWLFALLNGTNRLKTEKEVKAEANRIAGVNALKKSLANLAVGEQVSWSHMIKGFEFPPADMRKEIASAAAEAKLELSILLPEDR